MTTIRENLKNRHGERFTCKAIVECYGTKRNGDETILLRGVIDFHSGELLCDHIWFTVGESFRKLKARPGDYVIFDARAADYTKGYRGRRDVEGKPVHTDFKLSHPTKLLRVDSDGVEINPDGKPRVMRTGAGWFTIGRGLIYPAVTRQEAEERLSLLQT